MSSTPPSVSEGGRAGRFGKSNLALGLLGRPWAGNNSIARLMVDHLTSDKDMGVRFSRDVQRLEKGAKIKQDALKNDIF